MTQMIRSAGIFFILFALLVIGGCGYHIAGRGGKMPGGVTAVSIPVFANSTSKADAAPVVTTAFVNEFVTVVSVAPSAQARMEGTIKGYTLQAVSFSKSDVTQQYRLTVTMALRLVNGGEVLWEADDITRSSDFNVNSADVAATRDAEAEALRKIAADSARLIKERIMEGF